MAESAFNRKFRYELGMLGMKFYRIESRISPGMPDNHFLDRKTKRSGWIEVKQARTLPKAVAYRPLQVPWLTEYSVCGGRCWTAIHVSDDHRVVVVEGRNSEQAACDLRKTPVQSVSLSNPLCWEVLRAIFTGASEKNLDYR